MIKVLLVVSVIAVTMNASEQPPGIRISDVSELSGVVLVEAQKPILILTITWREAEDSPPWYDTIDGTSVGREVAAPGKPLFVAPRKASYDKDPSLIPSKPLRWSLEFVLFSDGERYGPDRSRTLQKTIARDRTYLRLGGGVAEGKVSVSKLREIVGRGGAENDTNQDQFWEWRTASMLLKAYERAMLEKTAETLSKRARLNVAMIDKEVQK